MVAAESLPREEVPAGDEKRRDDKSRNGNREMGNRKRRGRKGFKREKRALVHTDHCRNETRRNDQAKGAKKKRTIFLLLFSFTSPPSFPSFCVFFFSSLMQKESFGELVEEKEGRKKGRARRGKSDGKSWQDPATSCAWGWGWARWRILRWVLLRMDYGLRTTLCDYVI